MNKSKASQQFSKCNLRQLGIFTVIENWKSIKRKNDIKKTELYSTVIEIEDSDSEQAVTNNSSDIFSKKKRPLKCIFSDDEEDGEGTNTVTALEKTERKNFLKAKRPLQRSFSDDEEDVTDKQSNCHIGTTPIKTENVVNESYPDIMRPMACSTPLSASDRSTPDGLSDTYLGANDIFGISQVDNKTMRDCSSVSSTDTERNIIVEHHQDTPNQSGGKAIVKEHIIVPPNVNTTNNETGCNNTTRPISEHSGSFSKKRCAEHGEKSKKLKMNHTLSTSDAKSNKYSDISERLPENMEQSKIGVDHVRKSNPQKIQEIRKSISIETSRDGLKWLSKANRSGSKNEGNIEVNKPKTASYLYQEGSKQVTNNECMSKKNKISSETVPTSGSDLSAMAHIQKDVSKTKSGPTNTDIPKSSSNVTLPTLSTKIVDTVNVPPSMSSPENSMKRVSLDNPNSQNLDKSCTKIRRVEKSKDFDRINPAKTVANACNMEDQTKQTDAVNIHQLGIKKSNRDNNLKAASKMNKTASSPSKIGIGQPSTFVNKSLIAKKEEKSINKELLILTMDLFKTVFLSNHANNLLETEKKIIKTFLDMDFRYQYVCLKLITWKRRWYNVFKFCNRIHLDMEETDISEMFTVFEENNIIDTEYIKSDSIRQLLERLDNSDLRKICDNFRLKKTLLKKEEMIASLLKYSSTQTTLTIRKSTKDLLKDEITRRMGRSMRVNEAFQNAFYSTYVLGTFTNPRFSNIDDYFKSLLKQKVIFPQYPIDEYTIFSSRTDFVRYVEARKYRNELEDLPDHLECLQICRTIFQELKNIQNKSPDDRIFEDAPHLIRFTDRAVYVSALSMAATKLYAKFPKDVKTWLEYMIKKVNFEHRIGGWYCHLIWLYMKYIQPFNYDRAAELLIEVLEHKREHLSEVQLYQLRKRGEQLICTKKYKILQLNHDRIAGLLPKRIKENNFPETTIDAKTIRSNDLGKKRNYVVQDAEGNKRILTVEDIALMYYSEQFGYNGVHCEGALVIATFTLFFFDIIYSSRRSIPGTFVSKVQSEPLDMNTRYFYLNRREEIDKRLKEIECEWSDSKVIKFVKESYEKHSHEFSVCEVGFIIKDPKFLEIIVQCIGRTVLAKIYERLVKNFREYRSGLPDLFVWNVDRKECKFVEVKGENDKLSVGQTLWLNYLQSIGAQIEVCHVHSIGSKRKLKKVEGATSSCPDTEASTSSSASLL